MVSAPPLRIGVLALQGGVAEHTRMLLQIGITPVEVRLPEHLGDLDGIIFPGGESTAIAKLMAKAGLTEPLRLRLEQGLPAYGTCAGMILLARRVGESTHSILGLMDIRVKRNAYGAQGESFEAEVCVTGLEGRPVRGMFIRAPVVEEVGPGVEVLASLADGTPIVVREGTLLASAFHPELSDDARMHQLFAKMCRRAA
jgi:5'-phosphate synthase pdxT subunit